MELLEDRGEASRCPQHSPPHVTGHGSFADMRRGIRSGEICVRILGRALCAENGAAYGLAPGLRALAIEPPTLQQMMAPWRRKVDSLHQKRLHTQERRRLVRQRYEAARAALEGLVEEPRELIHTRCARRKPSAQALDRYGLVFDTLERLYAKYAMRAVLEYYALLEEERAWIAGWRVKEIAASQELVREAKRRYHIDSFAVHLESETSGQTRMWRLPEGDAQRTRCVKAASENVKKGFFGSETKARVEVKDVYKIENQPLLRGFEHWINQAPPGNCRVKGLLCCVPTESLERVAVWGMFADEADWVKCTGSVDDPVFNRPNATFQTHNIEKQEAPGTGPRYVALQRVLQAPVLQFPRRFSRYSTLDELRELPPQDLSRGDQPIRYLALCRVAMGKTQRISNRPAPMSEPDEFPTNASVGSLFYSEEEEYVIRYPQTVVPEFIIEFRYVSSDVERVDEHDSSSRIIPVCSSTRRNEPRPSKMLELAAQQLVNGLSEASTSIHIPAISMFPESYGTPSIFTKSRTAISRSIGNIPDRLSSETTLEGYSRRRRDYMEDIQSLRRQVWVHAKLAWDMLDQSVRRNNPDTVSNGLVTAAPKASNQNRNEAVKPQSMKARKLYGELALVRQLQEHDVAKLDALIKTKTVPNGKVKQKKDPAKPRPFR